MPTSGILLVDKATGWTSHDVVAKLRGVLGTRRVGHAGTLDPMATGLLVIGVEQGTRFLNYLVGLDKTYSATIRLGQSTVTDDAEGEPLEVSSQSELSLIDDEQIRGAISRLTGSIMQVPSAVSAIKVDGKRAYALVRGGDQVKLAARPVEISQFTPLSPFRRSEQGIDLDVEISCSTGTYIRAIARDLGALLGVGGHLTVLRRTRIGGFKVQEASPLATPSLITLAEAAAAVFPTIELTEQQETDLRHGKRIAVSSPASRLAALREGRLVAMLEPASGLWKSSAVFASELDRDSKK